MEVCQEMRMEVKGSERRRVPEEEKMEKVDLSGQSLETLPPQSLNVSLICHLDLSNNNLESIPESLAARLLNVVIFDVHSNQLKSLPNSIGCLSKLKILNVSGNMLESFPKTIENCRALEELNANFNKLTKLPDTMGFELHSLKKLSVNSNKLAYLPFSISHMSTLRVLDARLNCLRALPENLENLLNLQILNVSQNFHYLTSLPYSVGLLMSLVELDVSYNKITVLPDSVGCLKNLQKLHVEGNPIVRPPADIMEQRLEVVKEYLCERINNASNASQTKKKSWFGKLVRHKTFNGGVVSGGRDKDKDGFLLSDYRSIDGLTSPRYTGMFSPRRLFSPKGNLGR